MTNNYSDFNDEEFSKLLFEKVYEFNSLLDLAFDRSIEVHLEADELKMFGGSSVSRTYLKMNLFKRMNR